MSMYESDVFSSLGKISLDDLAGLLSGGKAAIAFSDHYQPRVHRDFPRGDARLIVQGEAHGTSQMYHSAARDYLKANFPRSPIPVEIAYPVTTDKWIELVNELESENLRLKAEKKAPEVEEDKPLTNCDKVTFGAVCFLLAQFGIVDRVSEGKNGELLDAVISEKVFQAPDLSPPSPNISGISRAIAVLATEKTNSNNPDAGFIDSGRRKAISDAVAAFLRQINKNKNS